MIVMKITKELKELMSNKLVFFATCDKKSKPNLICVEVNLVENNKIIFTNNMLNKTLQNLKENSLVSVAFYYGGRAFQVKGKAKIEIAGRYFEFVKNISSNKQWVPKSAIVIEVDEVWDLDSGKKQN